MVKSDRDHSPVYHLDVEKMLNTLASIENPARLIFPGMNRRDGTIQQFLSKA